MITKTQWHEFCNDIHRVMAQYPEWDKKIHFKGEEIEWVDIWKDVIHCVPRRAIRYVNYPYPFMNRLLFIGRPENRMKVDEIQRTIFKHPESIPEDRTLKQLYRDVKIVGEMTLMDKIRKGI